MITGNTKPGYGRRGNRWRIMGWGAAAFLLLLPLVAMQFTDEVQWTGGDFVIFGAMLALTGGALELTARLSLRNSCRAGYAIALLAAFFVVWANLAVGIIGNEENSANLLFYGVLAAGIIGAVIVRGRPRGMVRVMIVMAVAQALLPLVVRAAGLAGTTGFAGAYLFTGILCATWLASAWQFKRCRREDSSVR